jgi:hypothetical protein
MEGFLLYRAVVTVFETGETLKMIRLRLQGLFAITDSFFKE